MRNLSSVRSRRLLSLCGFLIAAALVASPRLLLAQCSSDDADSIACQMQGPVDSGTQSQSASTIFSIGEQAPRPALPELSTGPTFAEGASKEDSGRARTPAPANAPTEFQRFVAATTGQMLSVFGSRFFTSQPTSFGPVSNAPAPADLLLASGDELRIRIWGQVNFNANLLVSREGDLYLPKVGPVHVAGLTVADAQHHLTQAMDRIYRNFELTVDLGEIHSIQIYLTGLARDPGEFTVSALGTLVDAAFSSGGPAAAGSMRHLELRRAGKVLTDFDLYDLLIKGDQTGDMQLQPGDVLYIPPAGPQVALMGSVRQAGIYELRGQQTLGGLLAIAGGKTSVASAAQISVDRIVDRSRRTTFAIAGDDAGLASVLEDGDIVRIDPIASKYTDTVTLRGSVATPGRFRWRQGLRLSDLMPERDALVTRGYWWNRTRLGLPAPEFVAAPGEQTTSASPAEGSAQNRSIAGSASGQNSTELRSPGGETDWDYAVIERLDPGTMGTSLIAFDLGKLVLEHDVSEDRELQPGDVITIFSKDDLRLPIERKTRYVVLEGEVAKAGVYSVQPGETLRSVVERAGGLTTHAYLYGAEFTRLSTQRIEQQRMDDFIAQMQHLMERQTITFANLDGESTQGSSPSGSVAAANSQIIQRLGRLHASGRIVLDLAPQSGKTADLPELSLEDGDRLVVPAAPFTVQVIGSVFNQNAFIYRPGVRMSQYLRLAGGPRREADRHQIFVLRADGSVAHDGGGQSIFASSSLGDLRLYPGDTIVVPEKTVRPSAMRQFGSWSQLMSELALSAASVDVIK